MSTPEQIVKAAIWNLNGTPGELEAKAEEVVAALCEAGMIYPDDGWVNDLSHERDRLAAQLAEIALIAEEVRVLAPYFDKRKYPGNPTTDAVSDLLDAALLPSEPQPAAEQKVVSLMDALFDSVEQAKADRRAAPQPEPEQT